MIKLQRHWIAKQERDKDQQRGDEEGNL
jgi:hypothetical protein